MGTFEGKILLSYAEAKTLHELLHTFTLIRISQNAKNIQEIKVLTEKLEKALVELNEDFCED